MGYSLLFYIQKRSVVSFFCKYSSDKLWKSLTTISKAGKIRGNIARVYKNLDRGQVIGEGVIRTRFPGLNTDIKEVLASRFQYAPQVLQQDKDFSENVKKNQIQRDKKNRRGRLKTLHPMLRGWAGVRSPGRLFGLPELAEKDELYSNFQSMIIELRMISNMLTVGRVRNIKCLVIVGNGNGLVGFATAKKPLGSSAIRQAKNSAFLRLHHFELLDNRTIFQDFHVSYSGVRIFARRVPPGYGIVAHRVIEGICRLLGLKDIYCKVEGATTNYLNIVKAFFLGLSEQETHQQLADRKRLHVVEFSPTSGCLPIVRASPRSGKVRNEDEIDANEFFDVDESYGLGRQPWLPTKILPWGHLPGHLYAEWRKHPFRNLNQRRFELMTEGAVKNFHFENKIQWAEEQHQLVLSGKRPIPSGIGLSDCTRDKLED